MAVNAIRQADEEICLRLSRADRIRWKKAWRGNMPEVEADTDKLREIVDKQSEDDDSASNGGDHREDPKDTTFVKWVALSTALLAALASIASLKAGGTVNRSLILETRAAKAQSQAANQWAYFQAKGMKGAIQEEIQQTWLAVGKEPPPEYESKRQRYAREAEEGRAAALDKERLHDELNEESDTLMETHHGFSTSVAFFQVSIALGAVAALTKKRTVWAGSLILGLVATVLLIKGLSP